MGSKALEAFAAEMAEISAKPEADQATAVKKAVNALPRAQKDVISEALQGALPPPDSKTSNAIWLIIISCFAVVMILSAIILSISVFAPPVSDGTKPETILTVFMTVTAFLAGLFAPSPVPKKNNG